MNPAFHLRRLLLVALTAFGLPHAGAAGGPDPGFGGGRVVTDFGGTDAASAVAVQPDGRTIAVGESSVDLGSGAVFAFALARYTTAGVLDPTFANGGRLRIDPSQPADSLRARAVAVQPDGRIVVAGHTGFSGGELVVVRLTPAGGADPAFGVDGRVSLRISASGFQFDVTPRGVRVLPDGRLAVFGEVDIPTDAPAPRGLVVVLRPDGTPDPAFGGNGGPGVLILGITDPQRPFFVPVSGVYDAVLQGGRLVLAGGAGVDGQGGATELLLVRIDTVTGATDTSFGAAGRVRVPAAIGETFTSLVEGPDGRLLAAGAHVSAAITGAPLRLRRFEAHGAPDTSLAEPPLLLRSLPRLAPRTGAGGAWLALNAAPSPGGNFSLAALSASGALDTGFGSAGVLDIDLGADDAPAALALAPDGKPVLAGFTQRAGGADFAVVRVDPAASVSLPAPTGLSAVARAGGVVQLSWLDNAIGETGYAVERSTRADFTGAVRVATLPPDARAARDSGLAANTTYWYRVFATGAAGPSPAAVTSVRTLRR